MTLDLDELQRHAKHTIEVSTPSLQKKTCLDPEVVLELVAAARQNTVLTMEKEANFLEAMQYKQERDDLKAQLDSTMKHGIENAGTLIEAAMCMAEAVDCIKHGSAHRGCAKLEDFLERIKKAGDA